MDPRDAGHYYRPLPPQFRAPEFRAPGLMTPDGTYIPSGRVHPHFYEDFGQAAAFADVPQGMPYAGFEAAAPPARRMPGTAGAQTAGATNAILGEDVRDITCDAKDLKPHGGGSVYHLRTILGWWRGGHLDGDGMPLYPIWVTVEGILEEGSPQTHFAPPLRGSS
ncbi:hypothetical protein POSPLADRAFT_1143906 [Postia placenta MAD-698-R-SB12]|uniref:Uncharacterized protein n=1 Tax=Postia placenta MAD-698-R-SB12 TaxID=670580 RepID=A0A1X6MYQ6_9APHY|nr:hypothetical protein POSPLADRAFT_1143906 [Postia placenta MAD-698-R-SB12]OSX61495.1 hypothetical protein POSPLADRAFT_1143906 [Postia placenta MAD-698-R-SB12]